MRSTDQLHLEEELTISCQAKQTMLRNFKVWLKKCYIYANQIWTNITSEICAFNVFLNIENSRVSSLGGYWALLKIEWEHRDSPCQLLWGHMLQDVKRSVSWAKQWGEAAVGILIGPLAAFWHAARCWGSQHASDCETSLECGGVFSAWTWFKKM